MAAEMIAGAERYERRASAGPMQIASSASIAGRDSRSASEYATTASRPRVRQARRMRRAISPRFAIRTRATISDLPAGAVADGTVAARAVRGARLGHDGDLLAAFHRLARLYQALPR